MAEGIVPWLQYSCVCTTVLFRTDIPLVLHTTDPEAFEINKASRYLRAGFRY